MTSSVISRRNRLTSDAGDEVGAVTRCISIRADAEAAVAARIVHLARVVSCSDADAANRANSTSLTSAVSVDDVPHRALEPRSKHSRRHRQTRQIAHELRRYSTHKHVTVVAATEVERVPEHDAAVLIVIDNQERLGPLPPHFDVVPAAVVDALAERDVHVAVDLVGKPQNEPESSTLCGEHHAEEVGPSTVISVPQQDAVLRDGLSGPEVEGEGSVHASGPRREAGMRCLCAR